MVTTRRPTARRQAKRRRVASRARRQVRAGDVREPASAAKPIEPAAVDPRLIEGVALYNHRRFFECHEVLEQLWLKTHDASPACPGTRGAGGKDFYKGLIQAAVAFHHWSQGNQAGALTLARSASRYLKRYEPVFLGIDVEGFVTQFAELFQWLRRHRLRYDFHLVPAIRWVPPSTWTRVR